MKLYNSFSQSIEEFKPRNKGEVLMYVCGITPYDTTHMGHAFTYVFYDTLRRFLEYQDYKVIYTQNVTDVDDDLLKRARQTKQNWIELGNYWTEKFVMDMKTLNVIPPTHYIKATSVMPAIIEMVQTLVEKKYAYEVDGTVYFSVKTFPSYGQLSHYSMKEMIELSRERGADPDDPKKKDPLDFILWQKSLPDEPFWQSPFGKGRPGWHIECSTMIKETLGEQIDIHGGGIDLIYPHHESERAQSESATGKQPFVNYWVHTLPVRYEGEKMSKSLGNLVLVSDLLGKYSPASIRYLLLSYHYRETWEFTTEKLDEAAVAVASIHNALPSLPETAEDAAFTEKFVSYLDNDMNTPQALQYLLQSLETDKKGKKGSTAAISQQAVTKALDLVGIIL